jgi:ribosomal RNA-processing protein 17
MARTNREILTGGKKYANNKAKKHLVEEVVFDKGSRE